MPGTRIAQARADLDVDLVVCTLIRCHGQEHHLGGHRRSARVAPSRSPAARHPSPLRRCSLQSTGPSGRTVGRPAGVIEPCASATVPATPPELTGAAISAPQCARNRRSIEEAAVRVVVGQVADRRLHRRRDAIGCEDGDHVAPDAQDLIEPVAVDVDARGRTLGPRGSSTTGSRLPSSRAFRPREQGSPSPVQFTGITAAGVLSRISSSRPSLVEQVRDARVAPEGGHEELSAGQVGAVARRRQALGVADEVLGQHMPQASMRMKPRSLAASAICIGASSASPKRSTSTEFAVLGAGVVVVERVAARDGPDGVAVRLEHRQPAITSSRPSPSMSLARG